MNKTVWKPIDEIEFLLKDANKVSIISCGTCANLSDTGGFTGMKYLKGLLRDWGKQVPLARSVVACCPEAVMQQTFSTYKRRIGKSDAVVVLSCAAGIKSANLCGIEVPIISVLDPIGSVAISRKDNLVANSVCNACGRCVLTYTGGICPLSECPAKSKYGPCNKAPEIPGPCALDENRICVWHEIEKNGNLDALGELQKLHQDPSLERPVLTAPRPIPSAIRSLSGKFVARVQNLERIIRLIR